ncbi:DUF7547 family protein [Natrinema altunense]|uniref:Uncharacterized protein n=1 Tax=Natrinema altunense (strain JCM 12890 / CGMCC 1.3731 / AJ2) TaxID=1227494 RepID=L9ZVR6_NATA2|nr:hypothetical protein [Natrinema altunense]ELY89263.1 hypothetical protein C485_05166 [Natrinema altunense JCM 12890]
MADSDDELADAIRELARTIDALRDELEGPRSRRRPPLRPPTPRELLRFTDEVALPAVLAVLETSVRALEAFQRSLKVVRTGQEARDRTEAATDATSERASELRRTTLSQLDSVLSELQRAASEGGLPADEEARDLLAEARELRDDVDSRLRDAAERESRSGPTADSDRPAAERGVTIDIEDGPPTEDGTDRDDDPGRDSAVDVDAELETLRDQYADDEDGDSNAADSSEGDADGSDGDGSDAGTGADGAEDGSDEP